MLCQTNTPSPSVVLVDNPNLQPNKPHPAEMVFSAESIRKIQVLKERLANAPTGSLERNRLITAIWMKEHPDRLLKYSRNSAKKRAEWAKKNQEKRRAIALRYYYKHKPPEKQKILSNSSLAIRTRNRRKNNIQYMLASRLRATQNRAFRRQWIKKPEKTELLLGCTIAEAKSHIESQFTNGMNWDNRKSFVIDHHIPVKAFNLCDSEEAAIAFCWRNLRPITQHANATKSAQIPDPLPCWLPAHIAERIKSR